MKALSIITTICALVLVPAAASAQIEYSVGAGYTMPQGDFADAADNGFNINGQFYYDLGDMVPNLKAGGRLGYHYLGLSDSELQNVDGNYYMIEVLPAVRYYLMPGMAGWNLFLNLGVGMYHLAYDYDYDTIVEYMDNNGVVHSRTESVNAEGSNSELGINVGVGLEYLLNESMSLTLNPQYTYIDDADIIFINVGLKFR